METSGGSESSGGEDAEARRARRGHVLAELMQTERVYVQELGSILSVSFHIPTKWQTEKVSTYKTKLAFI